MTNISTLFESEFDRITKAGFDRKTASLYKKVIVMVTTAQGIIDNGGFEYFFETKFEGPTEYCDFIEVYREIGMHKCATTMEQAVCELSSKQPKFDLFDDVMFDQSRKVYAALEEYAEAKSLNE